MSDLRKAAQAALEVLEALQGGCTDHDDGTVEAITVWCPEVIDDLRAALAQPDQPTADGPTDWRAMHKVFSHWFLSQHAKTALIPEDVAWAAWKQAYAEGVAQERERCAQQIPDEWLVKVRRLVKGFEHVSGIARLWEPDYSSGSERALWSRATEACADVTKLLNAIRKG